MTRARGFSPVRGFTLIEVLVALVIVALGMSAVMSALTSAADNTGRLREKSFAEWVGLNQVAATRLAPGQPAAGKKEGDVDFAGGRWRWVQQVTPMEIPGVMRIEVQVRRLPGAAKEESGDKAAASASAGDNISDKGPPDWLATVTGFKGDKIGSSPTGTFDEWDSVQQAQGTGGPGGIGGGGAAPAPTPIQGGGP